MGIFLFQKDTLRCPKCGGFADKNDGYTTCPKCNCDLIPEAEYKSMGYHHPDPDQPRRPTVECPYCHSINTKKISTASKAVHTAVFGVFSLSRNSKNYHCNSCNSDF